MSKIEVNEIVKASGSTLTIGGCGTAVTLGSGATQTGFGRSGSVDWQTSSVKTSTFTAESGKGYFCNTTGGTFEVDLPAGSAGAIVAIQDYNNTFDTNNLTVDPNGSEKINGGTGGGFVTLSTEGLGLTFVYIDSTVGWRTVQSNFTTAGSVPLFVAASGGNTVATVDTNYKVHTFTSPGTFTVSCAGNSAGSNTVSYMVVAGGGGANQNYAGGGGAGGFREGLGLNDSYSGSPLRASTGVPVTATGFPITIGAGGGAQPTPSCRGITGSNSVFSSITSAGGGGGGAGGNPGPSSNGPGLNGGSGGGAGGYGPGSRSGGTGNTPPVSPPQGNPGGSTNTPGQGYAGSSGGGATAVGGSISNPTNPAGNDAVGGAGATTSINGTPTAYAGGGAGNIYGPGLPNTTVNDGGAGGGGQGTKNGSNPLPAASQNGTANTGGGAGGGGNSAGGYSGGSGIVIIRYKFQ